MLAMMKSMIIWSRLETWLDTITLALLSRLLSSWMTTCIPIIPNIVFRIKLQKKSKVASHLIILSVIYVIYMYFAINQCIAIWESFISSHISIYEINTRDSLLWANEACEKGTITPSPGTQSVCGILKLLRFTLKTSAYNI